MIDFGQTKIQDVEGFSNIGSRYWPPEWMGAEAKPLWAAPNPDLLLDSPVDVSYVTPKLGDLEIRFGSGIAETPPQNSLLSAKTTAEALEIGESLFGAEIDAMVKAAEKPLSIPETETEYRTAFYEKTIKEIDEEISANPFVFVGITTKNFEYPLKNTEQSTLTRRIKKFGAHIVAGVTTLGAAISVKREPKPYEKRMSTNQKRSLKLGGLTVVAGILSGVLLAAPSDSGSENFRIPAVTTPVVAEAQPGRFTDTPLSSPVVSVAELPTAQNPTHANTTRLPIVFRGDAPMDTVHPFSQPPVIPTEKLSPKNDDGAEIGDAATVYRMPLGLLSDYKVKDPDAKLQTALDAFKILYKQDYELRDDMRIWLKGTNTMLDGTALGQLDTIITNFYGPDSIDLLGLA